MSLSVVKLLILVVVCLAIFSEIEGPRSPDRRSRSRSRSRSPPSPVIQRMRRGFTGLVSSFSRRGNGGGNGASTSRRVPRIGSQSRMPPIPAPLKITASNSNDMEVIATFAQMQQNQGDSAMTLAQFNEKKDLMIEIANSDSCRSDRRVGGLRCVEALKALQAIPQEWRGTCGKAFLAQCYQWPAPNGWKRSFFMKISRGNAPPLDGYVYSIRDCANALSPDQYEEHLKGLNDFADSLFAK